MSQLHERAREHICALSDGELVSYIVTGTDAYEEEAVECAQEEFQRRKLDPALVEGMEKAAIEDRRIDRAARAEAAERPLDWSDQFLAFLAGFFLYGLIHLIIADTKFHISGEHRKAREMWRATVLGFISIVVTLVLFGTWHKVPGH